MTNTIPSKAFTHSGLFHADDVFGAALLRMLNPDVELTRGPSVPEGYDGIAFDIGGGRYDHHGRQKKLRPNGAPYAAFGLLWRDFGTILLDEEDALTLERELVEPIDVADNGGAPCLLTRLVSDFNPYPPATPEDFDAAFDEATSWALGVLSRRSHSMRHVRAVQDEVRTRMTECDGRVLILHSYLPWKQTVIGSGYLYVISPSPRGGFNVQCVPESVDSQKAAIPFPYAWWGQPADVLHTMTGINGFSFCHAAGFLCAAEDLEAAKQIANLAISEGKDVAYDK